MKYVKKQIDVEAVQFTGKNFLEISIFSQASVSWDAKEPNTLFIPGRNIKLNVGDWLVKETIGTLDTLYPCVNEVFKRYYEININQYKKEKNLISKIYCFVLGNKHKELTRLDTLTRDCDNKDDFYATAEMEYIRGLIDAFAAVQIYIKSLSE
jgi:hypothetical protein